MACSALQLISTQRATVVLVLHRCGDAVVLHVHEGPLDLLVRRRGLELGHEVAVARGAGLVGLGVDRGLRDNRSASGLLSSVIIDTAGTSASAGSWGGASPPPIASFAAPMRPSIVDEFSLRGMRVLFACSRGRQFHARCPRSPQLLATLIGFASFWLTIAPRFALRRMRQK